MNIVLWVIQVLLAAGFLMAGGMKLMTPHDALAAQMAWVNHMPAIAPKLIGLLEVLGALGLILPALLRIKPGLTPLAASCLALLMVGAFITHLLLGEYPMSLPSLVMGGLAAFVAWGRKKRAPILPR